MTYLRILWLIHCLFYNVKTRWDRLEPIRSTGGHNPRVRSFWSRSLRSGTLRSRSFGSEAKFGHFGRGHYGPGHFGRGHFCLYFRQ